MRTDYPQGASRAGDGPDRAGGGRGSGQSRESAGVQVPDTLDSHLTAHLDRACVEMRNCFADRWEELDERRQEAQEARDELRRFKQGNKLERKGRGPALRNPWAVLGAIAAGATVVVWALLFEQADGTLFGELPEAFLITVLNVVAVGLLGRQAIGLIVHRSLVSRILGWVCAVLAWAPLAISINLGAAHYRDALRHDWPGLVRIDSTYVDPETASDSDDEVFFHSCQKSTADMDSIVNDPDVEALCMLGQADFGLYMYKSYLLFWVGILTGILATVVWAFGMSDPYPGFGRLESEWRESEKRRRRAESEAVRAVAAIHLEAVEYAADHVAALADAGDDRAGGAMERAHACRAEVEGRIRAAAQLGRMDATDRPHV